MMKQETLKKIVELADGFELEWLSGTLCIHTPDHEHWGVKTFNKTNGPYPLLLRRAVEGWNKSNSTILHFIDLRSDHIECVNDPYPNSPILLYKDYPTTEYLTPQEQAIEACLIELLEK